MLLLETYSEPYQTLRWRKNYWLIIYTILRCFGASEAITRALYMSTWKWNTEKHCTCVFFLPIRMNHEGVNRISRVKQHGNIALLNCFPGIFRQLFFVTLYICNLYLRQTQKTNTNLSVLGLDPLISHSLCSLQISFISENILPVVITIFLHEGK